MKKILAVLLAALLVLSMGVAFASGEDVDPVQLELTDNGCKFTKTYNVTGTGASIPADVLKFTYEFVSFENDAVDETDKPTAENSPTLKIDDVTVTEGATSPATIAVDFVGTFPKPGVYTYEITETDTHKAGVVYSALNNPLTLKVTVIDDNGTIKVDSVTLRQNGEKTDNIENEYEAHQLTVKKTVTGNMADRTKPFTFTVVLTPPDGDTVNAKVTIAGQAKDIKDGETPVTTEIDAGWDSEKTITFTLTDNDTITFGNLPKGVSYTVAENKEDYNNTKHTNDSGEITTEDISSEFENEKSIEIDTGITLDSLPYALIAMITLAGVALMIVRRRRSYEN